MRPNVKNSHISQKSEYNVKKQNNYVPLEDVYVCVYVCSFIYCFEHVISVEQWAVE